MKGEELVVQIIEGFFKKHSIKFKKHQDYNLLLIQYFNLRIRHIKIIKRRLKISNQLSLKIPLHPAKLALEQIFGKTESGNDLNPYQSLSLLKSNHQEYNDLLFNEWGIHHLHLTIKKHTQYPYFMERGDYLVYVKFTNDTAYFLDVLEHEQNNWGNSDLVKIVRDNWPELIEIYKVGWLTPNLPDNEMLALRKKGYTKGVNIDEEGFLPMGHGYTSSGHNSKAILMTSDVIRWIGKNLGLFERDRKVFKEQLLIQLYL